MIPHSRICTTSFVLGHVQHQRCTANGEYCPQRLVRSSAETTLNEEPEMGGNLKISCLAKVALGKNYFEVLPLVSTPTDAALFYRRGSAYPMGWRL